MIAKNTIFFIFLFTIIYSSISAQETRLPLHVSHLIGDTLSAVENEYYNLFPKIEGFQYAVFYRNSNDSLDVKVKSLIDVTLQETLLKNYFTRTELINHLERVAKVKSLWNKADTTVVQRIIVKKNNGTLIEGEIINVIDSMIVIKPIPIVGMSKTNKDSTEEFSFSQISSVTIKKDSKILSGMGNGFLIGAGFGASIGLIDGNDTGKFINFSAGQKALGMGISLGVIGALIGTAVGAGSSEDEEIIIRTKEDLRYLKRYLKRYLRFPYPIYKKNITPIPKQTTVSLVKPKISFKKRFAISIFGATTSSGPAAEIEYQMKMHNFDQTTHGGWFSSGDIIHPKSYTGLGQIGTPWLLSLKYYQNKTISFGALYSENPIGMTTGYNNLDGYLELHYSVNTAAAMTWFKHGILSIGVGPALYFTKTWEPYEIDNTTSSDKSTPGLIFEFGLTYPAYSSFYIAVLIQYRFVGNIEVGPYYTWDNKEEPILPSFEVSYNHSFIGVGTGIRL